MLSVGHVKAVAGAPVLPVSPDEPPVPQPARSTTTANDEARTGRLRCMGLLGWVRDLGRRASAPVAGVAAPTMDDARRHGKRVPDPAGGG